MPDRDVSSSPWRQVQLPAWLVRSGMAAWLALGVVALGVLAVLALSTLQSIVLPVVFAAVAAAVFRPITARLERAGWPGTLAAFATIVLILGLLGGALALVTRAVLAQQDELTAAFAAVWADLQAWFEQSGLDGDVVQQAREALANLGASGGGGLLSSAASAASSAAALVLGLFLGLVFLFFLLRDAELATVWLNGELGSPDAVRVTEVGSTAVLVIRRYFAGRGVVAAVDAVLIGLGAAILGVPLVPAIAVLTFIGGFIPYLGAFLAGALAVVLGLAEGGLTIALLMLAVVLLVQTVIEPLVEARVLGTSLGLHPMLVILVTTAGGIVAGFPGLILAAPLAGTAVGIRRLVREGRAGEEASPDG